MTLVQVTYALHPFIGLLWRLATSNLEPHAIEVADPSLINALPIFRWSQTIGVVTRLVMVVIRSQDVV